MKRFIKSITVVTIVFAMSNQVFAKPISGLVNEVSKDIVVVYNNEIHIDDNTLIVDAVKGEAINYEQIMKMQPAYVYESDNKNVNDFEVVIANIPQDFKAPALVTIKETNKIDDNTLEFTIIENNNKYTITKDTLFNRIYPYNMASIKSIPTFDELTSGTKVLIYLDNKTNLTKCLITPFKELDKNIDNKDKISINGNIIELEPYTIENTLYLPIRPIAEAFGYKLSWDANLKSATIEKNEQKLTIKANYENFIKDGYIYVSKDFIKTHLKINVTEKDNIIYVG